jgi:hypothetical protein
MKEYPSHTAAWVDYDLGNLKAGEKFRAMGEVHVIKEPQTGDQFITMEHASDE